MKGTFLRGFGRDSDIPMLAMAIKGRIKIGRKADQVSGSGSNRWRRGEGLDHFLVVRNERETVGPHDPEGNFLVDEELMERLCPPDGPLMSIPVSLPYDDPAAFFSAKFQAYKGKTRLCTGDGFDATWDSKVLPLPKGLEVLDGESDGKVPIACQGLNCPLYRGIKTPDGRRMIARCRLNTRLVVSIIGDETMGAAHLFITSSFNSTRYLQTSLLDLARRTEGALSSLRLNLVVSEQISEDRETGEPKKIHVVRLEFRGNRLRMLTEAADRRKQLSAATQKLLEAPAIIDVPIDSDKTVVAEYYPDLMEGQEPEKKPKQPEKKPKQPEKKPKQPEKKPKQPEKKPKQPETLPCRPENLATVQTIVASTGPGALPAPTPAEIMRQIGRAGGRGEPRRRRIGAACHAHAVAQYDAGLDAWEQPWPDVATLLDVLHHIREQRATETPDKAMPALPPGMEQVEQARPIGEPAGQTIPVDMAKIIALRLRDLPGDLQAEYFDEFGVRRTRDIAATDGERAIMALEVAESAAARTADEGAPS